MLSGEMPASCMAVKSASSSGICPCGISIFLAAGAAFHRGPPCDGLTYNQDMRQSLLSSLYLRCTRFRVASLISSSVTGVIHDNALWMPTAQARSPDRDRRNAMVFAMQAAHSDA